jgi:hypothetical protein
MGGECEGGVPEMVTGSVRVEDTTELQVLYLYCIYLKWSPYFDIACFCTHCSKEVLLVFCRDGGTEYSEVISLEGRYLTVGLACGDLTQPPRDRIRGGEVLK